MDEWTEYHVSPRDDGWAVVKKGASRASSVEATKEAAVAQARKYAQSQQPSKVIVYKQDGTIQETFTYAEADGSASYMDRLPLPNLDADALIHEVKVRGDQLVDRVREIVAEGNARRVIIKKDGQSVLELPLSVGVGGAAAAILLSPVLAALGAFAALVNQVTIVVERVPETTDTPALPPGE